MRSPRQSQTSASSVCTRGSGAVWGFSRPTNQPIPSSSSSSSSFYLLLHPDQSVLSLPVDEEVMGIRVVTNVAVSGQRAVRGSAADLCRGRGEAKIGWLLTGAWSHDSRTIKWGAGMMRKEPPPTERLEQI
ncbi:unnamed protein product [Pleuronectes platessa]|uniref:Uncharacterized protein n=1 Tax=Pleuronectes platessa TaxID=8262 RepID=A0A9N7TJH9_PLEPL|nr:unnamed protein product [Pleuronectes platessa]